MYYSKSASYVSYQVTGYDESVCKGVCVCVCEGVRVCVCVRERGCVGVLLKESAKCIIV